MRTILPFKKNGRRIAPILIISCLIILWSGVFQPKNGEYRSHQDAARINNVVSWERPFAEEIHLTSRELSYTTTTRRRLQEAQEVEVVSISNDTLVVSDASESETVVLDEGSDLAVVVSFEDILRLTVFIATAWLLSNICVAVGLPGLVGEIMTGFLLGPPLANFCPYPEAMVLIGNFGLIGLMLESGIHLDIVQLRETGTRAVMIALTGTVVALLSGLGLGFIPTNVGETSFSSAMAIGAAFAPSSLGVAASVLSAGEVLNTPTGQLIVASSVVDDVMGLILLAILNVFVMEDPTVFNYIQPFLASFGFLIVLGYLGIRWIPFIIKKKILPKVPEAQREKATFALMFLLLIIYLPVLNYSGASYLTGAFLAGLSVSQLPSIHTSYSRNGREIMVWLMRVFFAATIGFQVPIRRYSDPYILRWSAKFLIPIVAKLPLGLMVPHFRKEVPSDFPFNPYHRDAIIASLSVVCRGEFNFVVASFGLSAGLLDADIYSAIVLAVLISSVIAPLMLSRAIRYYNGLSEGYLKTPRPVNRLNHSDTDGYRPLFIAIQIRTPASWGLHERFQHTLEDLGLMILDHRTWHTNEMEAVTMSEIFVQDTIKNVKVKNCFFKKLSSGTLQPTEPTALSFGDGSIPVSMAPCGTLASDSSEVTSSQSSSLTKTIDLKVIRDVAVESVGADSTENEEDTLRVMVSDGSSSRIGICGKKAIAIRLDQVRLKLVASLGDMKPEKYVVKTTQWEPFLLDGPADEKGHERQRTYTFQEDPPFRDIIFPPSSGENDGDESFGELSIFDAPPSSTNHHPLTQNQPTSRSTNANNENEGIQQVRFGQQDESPRTPKLPARPQPYANRGVSQGTNYSATAQARRQQNRSRNSFSGVIRGDLWETDEVAHKCVGRGKCHFQPIISGHTVADERFLALASGYASDDEDDDEEEERRVAPSDVEANSPGHRRRRSRRVSEDWRQEEESAAIQQFLHGYIRHA